MSRANNPIKVLRTALKRIDKGWRKGAWGQKNADGSMEVCLEGAIYGFCNLGHMATPAQKQALSVVQEILKEKFPERYPYSGEYCIPSFNDHEDTTKDEVKEVVKLAIIRLETGWSEDEPDVPEEELDDLFAHLATKK